VLSAARFPPIRGAAGVHDSRLGARLVLGEPRQCGGVPSDRSRSETRERRRGLRRELPDGARITDDPAYILYTSGSTGRRRAWSRPSGHSQTACTGCGASYPFRADDVGVMRTELNFVDAFWEVLGGVLKGIPTVVAREPVVRDPHAFVDSWRSTRDRMWFVRRISRCCWTPSGTWARILPALRFWSVGGEPLTARLFDRFVRRAHGRLYNVYGASEFWTRRSSKPSRETHAGELIPIGRPIANVEALRARRGRPARANRRDRPPAHSGRVPGSWLHQSRRADRQRFVAHPSRPGARDVRTRGTWRASARRRARVRREARSTAQGAWLSHRAR
jgi:non-ribosomal peptide synthetase component F